MPVVKPTESLGVRPVVIVLYGDPGICKTSLANTCDSPILLDFDRGVQRSFGRKDTLVLDNWDEVINEEAAGTFKNYKTVVIDTAKAALDDFLMVYVVKQDYKMASNKLKAYGEIGDKFKLFVNNRRAEGVDIVIIAHAKKDEDTKRHVPDVTGQSYQLLMRIADQVGYVTMENNKRVIGFNPTDLTVGKNVAGLGKLEIPDKADPAFRNYGAYIISEVKNAIDDMNEEQREALEKSAKYQEQIAAITNPDELTDLLSVVKELPDYLKVPLQALIIAKAKDSGWVANKTTQRFEVAPTNGTMAPATNGTAPATNGQAAPVANQTTAQAPDPLFGIISNATGLDHLASIEKANIDRFAASPELVEAFRVKKESFAPTAAPAANGTAAAPAPKRAPRAPKATPAPQQPVAAKQDLKWFQERVGKDVWMQGSNPDQWTGPYFIEHEGYPEFCLGQQQEGYTFRDMTAAEIAAAKEEVASV
jgi:hypothetical protein